MRFLLRLGVRVQGMLARHPGEAELRLHALSALKAAQAARVARHIASCRDCAARSAQLARELELSLARIGRSHDVDAILLSEWPKLRERIRAAQAALASEADFLGELAGHLPAGAGPGRAAGLLRAFTGMGERPRPPVEGMPG